MGIDKVSLPSRLKTKSIIAGVAASVAAAISLPSAAAGIELGEGLSVTGFADMSFFSSDVDGFPTTDSFGIDQFEMDFMYAGSAGVSAQVDIEYGESSAGGPGDDDTFVEQAFITKQFNDQFSMKVGRFLSYSGWETEEPTGLFQYSGVGYAPYFYGYYQQGISAAYNAGKFGFTASLVNSVFNPLDRDTGELSYELGLSVQPIEGLTAKVFYLSEKVDALDDETTVINAWVSYAMSGFTFAAEYNTAEYAGGGDGDGYLLMANYASGPWGITGRYHDYEVDGTADVSGFTISPSYKVGDNLLLVAEYRMDDLSGGVDAKGIAFEALFTF
jgi:hypothetical protein